MHRLVRPKIYNRRVKYDDITELKIVHTSIRIDRGYKFGGVIKRERDKYSDRYTIRENFDQESRKRICRSVFYGSRNLTTARVLVSRYFFLTMHAHIFLRGGKKGSTLFFLLFRIEV